MSSSLDILTYILRSLYVTSLATLFSAIFALPLGLALGLSRKKIARHLRIFFRSLVVFPTIVVGLFVYMIISRSGPLGPLGLLYTRAAIIVGQSILIFPLIVSYTAYSLSDLRPEMKETLELLRPSRVRLFWMVVVEKRYVIVTVLVSAWARAVGEIGVSMMLGGNIRSTRTVTTAIAFEAGRGAFSQAIILGIFLIMVALLANFLIYFISGKERFDAN
ncbi:MAG: ABC transporter permease [Spirochaetales bacterium]|nr:ABC transporter permease [Spirochaetales bacterium]